MDKDLTIKVFITNLAKYNAGRLVGEWVNLPADDLGTHIKEILGNDEEIFITDYEAPFEIEEYDNIEELNEFAERWDELSDYDKKKVLYMIRQGYDKEDAIDNYENDCEFYPGMTLEKLAEEFLHEGIYGDVSAELLSYIDLEKLAHELSLDYDEQPEGVFRLQ